MASPAAVESDTTRVTSTIETTLLLQVCSHLERKHNRRLQMSEVLRIVMSEYAQSHCVAR